MKALTKAVYGFVGCGIVVLLSAQFLGASAPVARLIYMATPALIWLLGLWLLALAGLVLYLVFSGIAGNKIIPFLTGIYVEAPAKDYNANALKIALSSIVSVLLIISFFTFVRVDVHTGYECEISGNTEPCAAKPNTKRILFMPAITLPGAGLSSITLPETGNMGYFIANTPPVGGDTAAWLAFLTLLFIAISRISLMVSKKRAGV